MINTDNIKSAIADIHEAHGGSGDPLRCTECVLAGLDEIAAERDFVWK